MIRSRQYLSEMICYCDLAGLLEVMQEGGSSVALNYGEDTGQWECSWIVGGERYTDVRSNPEDAAAGCIRQVRDLMPA